MRLLDLFCGAGGAAVGYHRAGFDEIVGLDTAAQPRYPFTFIQADALEYVAEHGHEFDMIHASPPCQGYSIMNNLPWNRDREYPMLILPTREALKATGRPWCIENVGGARYGAKGLKKRGLEEHGMQAGWLCGGMFGMPLYRHRLFETNFFWMQPGHPKHVHRIRPGRFLAGRARDIVFSKAEDVRGIKSWPGRDGMRGNGLAGTATGHEGNLATWQYKGSVGTDHSKGWRLAAEAMGIDWMKRDELTQAIPPAFTEFVGLQALRAIEVTA